MTDIAFHRVAEDEARILAGGECVGGLYRRPDILDKGAAYYVIHLFEDPRGPARVHDRSRVREEAERRVASHPYR